MNQGSGPVFYEPRNRDVVRGVVQEKKSVDFFWNLFYPEIFYYRNSKTYEGVTIS